jgi:hypothetical protein
MTKATEELFGYVENGSRKGLPLGQARNWSNLDTTKGDQ